MKNRIAKYSNEARRVFAKMKMERRSPDFKKLIEQDRAWALYVMLIQNYIAACKRKKADMNLATASEADKKRLANLDQEVVTLEWAIKIPQRTIGQALVSARQDEEDNLLEEIEADMEKERSKQNG